MGFKMNQKMKLLLDKIWEAHAWAYVSGTDVKISQVEKVLYGLLQNKHLTSRDFVNMNIFRYSSVIEILRNKHDVPIITEWVKGKLYKYSIPEEAKI